MTRAEAGGEPERIVVLATVGARPRVRRGRRKAPVAEGGDDAGLVPSVRATVIRTAAFESREDADAWLDRVRRERDELEEEARAGARELNALLRTHRAAVADPYVRDVAPAGATVVRVGHGSGHQVSEGRFDAAIELPPPSPRSRIRRRADALAPDERLAAVLGRREELLASEELVLRARADIEAARPREAALQARIALETVLAELRGDERLADDVRSIESERDDVARAANEALAGDVPDDLQDAVARAVDRIETALRRHRIERR